MSIITGTTLPQISTGDQLRLDGVYTQTYDNLTINDTLIIKGTLNAKHIICDTLVVNQYAIISQPSLSGGTSIDGNVTVLSVDPASTVDIFQDVNIQGVLTTVS